MGGGEGLDVGAGEGVISSYNKRIVSTPTFILGHLTVNFMTVIMFSYDLKSKLHFGKLTQIISSAM